MCNVFALRKFSEFDAVLGEPSAPRFKGGNLGFDFLIIDKSTVCRVGKEHLAWLQTSLSNNLGWVDVCNADF
ncbi:unannotated protein [freshwater metagenome]|uniref:Unannotated protein n=1 Tax=freshwater metagenome TaxID=449393 RepID=A0A6J6HWF2_9ZZZZ